MKHAAKDDAALLAIERESIRQAMSQQRRNIVQALERGQTPHFQPRSHTFRFIARQAASVDRLIGKAITTLVLSRLFRTRRRKRAK